MSISSIPGITGAARVPTSTADGTATAASPARPARSQAAASPQGSISPTPAPLRFPWLSRLTEQLETAAKQKPAFPAAPVLGDNVDKSA